MPKYIRRPGESGSGQYVHWITEKGQQALRDGLVTFQQRGGVRSSDGETAEAAADTVNVDEKSWEILRVLNSPQHRNRGMTWDDVVRHTEILRQSISPRWRNLLDLGLIERRFEE